METSSTCDGVDDCGDNSDEILPCDGNYVIAEYTFFGIDSESIFLQTLQYCPDCLFVVTF